ncbi:MAG: aquaporin [Patescibacteria group bacterium]
MLKQIKPFIVEFFGTFALSLIVMLSVMAAQFPISTPFLAAFTLGLFVYTVGHIGGVHLNPAVTIAILSIRKIHWRTAVFYIISQFAGAALAILVAYGFGIGQADATSIPNNLRVALGEAIGALFFLFGIASVVYGRVSSNLSGIVIGGSLVIGSAFAAILGVGGLLNPAIAFTIGAFNLAYIIGPIVGAVVGAQIYTYLSEK